MGAKAYPAPDNGSKETAVSSENRMYQRGQDIKGKPLVDIQRGEKLGVVADLLFDPDTLAVAALAAESGTLFNREEEFYLADQVEVWGIDVILVRRQEKHTRTVPGRERLVNLSSQLRGRPVVSSSGTRVGQVGDVRLDEKGRVESFELSQVYIEGPLQKSKRIPVHAAQALGKDVLIVDTDKL